jgi:hypothetical protein
VNAADIVAMPLNGVGTLLTRIETQREQVKRMVKAEIQSLRHIRAHPDDAIALIADLFEMDRSGARDVYQALLPSFSEDGTVERPGIETVIELEREGGTVAVPATYEQVTDASIAMDAQRELGLRP